MKFGGIRKSIAEKKNFLITFASYCGYLRRWAILHGPVFCLFCQRLLIKICDSKSKASGALAWITDGEL